MRSLVGRVLLLWLVACERDKAEQIAAPGPSRVVSVAASKQAQDAEQLCDDDAVRGRPFAYPELAGPAPAPKPGRFRWINLWATWCPPCVEELGLITQFERELQAAGVPVDLILLSVDQTRDIMAAFQREHPEADGSLRVQDPGAVEPWLSKLGMAGSPALPIHLFIAPNGALRCARSGALTASDLPAVKALLSAGS